MVFVEGEEGITIVAPLPRVGVGTIATWLCVASPVERFRRGARAARVGAIMLSPREAVGIDLESAVLVCNASAA